METLIIANPVGGSFNKEIFEKSVKIIKNKLDNVKVIYTEYPLHATKIAKESNSYLIISAGGDGIINEVVNGIEGKDCLFYPLPFGTANVFCREKKIPLDPIKAAKQITLENFESIYLGKIADKYFIQMVGFGFDSNAVKRVNLNIKKKFGKIAYVIAGIEQLIKNDAKQLEFFVNGKKYIAYNAIFSVGKLYAGQFYLSKNKKENKLLVCYHTTKSRLSLIKTVIAMFLGFGFNNNMLETENIKIISQNFCQLDGDFFELKNNTNYIQIKKASFLLVK